MMTKKMDRNLRFLLLQARLDHMKHHEHECFAARLGLQMEDIDIYDMTKGAPSRRMIRNYTGVLIGGSGEFSVAKMHLSWLAEIEDLTRWIIDQDLIMFCSCFGHHILAKALGAKVEYLPESREVGTYLMTLTMNGSLNPLFQNKPRKFLVQLGHQDHVTEIPKGCIHLAETKLCRYQVFQVADRLIYTCQFHPELTCVDMIKRVDYYGHQGYVEKGATADEIKKEFKEAPESYNILSQFVNLINKRLHTGPAQ